MDDTQEKVEVDTSDMIVTHRKIVTMLSDGKWHSADELRGCLALRKSPEDYSPTALRNYLYTLRKLMRVQGYGLSVRFNEVSSGKSVTEYQLRKFIAPEETTS